MSGVNTVAISNQVNIDRHQDDIHRGPMINQVQNNELTKAENDQKIIKPAEAEQSEGKNIDANDKKNQKHNLKKRNKPALSTNKESKKLKSRGDEGFLVDICA